MNLIVADDIAAVPAKTFLMTLTTSPMLPSETIMAALTAHRLGATAGTADWLFTVNRFKTRFNRADGSAATHDPDNLIQTQYVEPWFEENSNPYIFTKDSFAGTNARVGRKPLLFPMNKLEAVEIDAPEDWAMAEPIAALHLINKDAAQ